MFVCGSIVFKNFWNAKSAFSTFLFLNWFQLWSYILGGYHWGNLCDVVLEGIWDIFYFTYRLSDLVSERVTYLYIWVRITANSMELFFFKCHPLHTACHWERTVWVLIGILLLFRSWRPNVRQSLCMRSFFMACNFNSFARVATLGRSIWPKFLDIARVISRLWKRPMCSLPGEREQVWPSIDSGCSSNPCIIRGSGAGRWSLRSGSSATTFPPRLFRPTLRSIRTVRDTNVKIIIGEVQLESRTRRQHWLPRPPVATCKLSFPRFVISKTTLLHRTRTCWLCSCLRLDLFGEMTQVSSKWAGREVTSNYFSVNVQFWELTKLERCFKSMFKVKFEKKPRKSHWKANSNQKESLWRRFCLHYSVTFQWPFHWKMK